MKTLSADLAGNPRALARLRPGGGDHRPARAPEHHPDSRAGDGRRPRQLLDAPDSRPDAAARRSTAGPSLPDEADALYRVLNVFLHVCDAVAFAHSRGVIHGDIKPDNVMVGRVRRGLPGRLGRRLADPDRRRRRAGLGIQRAPHASGVRGTPAFMAPEQAKGVLLAIGERTDVFGLGALLYFILTGRPPFEGATASETLTRARAGLFPDPERTRARRAGAGAVPDRAQGDGGRRRQDRHARVAGAAGGRARLPQRRPAFPVARVRARRRSSCARAIPATRRSSSPPATCIVQRSGARRAARDPPAGAGRRVRRDRNPVAHGAHRDRGRDRRGDGQDRDAGADRGAAGAQHLAGAVRARARRSLPRGRRKARASQGR